VERDGSTASDPNSRVEAMCNGDRDGLVEAIGQRIVFAEGDSFVWPPDLERRRYLSCRHPLENRS
jgi:hypothetical protein